ELVPNRDNRNLVQPNVLDSKTAGNSASPQAAKTMKTAPGTQTGTVTGKQAPGKAGNTATPAPETSQPATVRMIDPNHNLVEVPTQQYQSRLNHRYQLVVWVDHPN